ncbi:hypothetical protein L9F63_020751 [Diploptera punctata]|uniref:ZMYM2-like/QRICH1 C-terminal domain-containing protein n=1 Tax=Diploptera punctata TaxID=6984 RepID=A0AAD7ZQV3_DIPPU|nr:hypothetical protein L9F63_020751 [Diploptera punctata]
MGSLACPLCCTNKFANQQSLKQHLLEILKNVYCSQCDKNFETVLQFACHLDGMCGNVNVKDEDEIGEREDRFYERCKEKRTNVLSQEQHMEMEDSLHETELPVDVIIKTEKIDCDPIFVEEYLIKSEVCVEDSQITEAETETAEQPEDGTSSVERPRKRMFKMAMADTRFGCASNEDINEIIQQSKPKNPQGNRKYIWSQFDRFCQQRNYVLTSETPTKDIANILKDWGVNMRKINGEEYKEYTLKTMWNVTAKMIQEKYFIEHHRDFNPFIDQEFNDARRARNAKRKILQNIPEKRKVSAVTLKSDEYEAMINNCNEKTPEGLQMKFFFIASLELAWRMGEAVKCLIHYFQEELDHNGEPTGRIAYNPMFSSTCQGYDQKLCDTKWLIPNQVNPSRCPVRLYKILLQKRTDKIKTDRFFITPNPFYRKSGIWYKNCPVGQNQLSTWTKMYAEKSGLTMKKHKVCNRSTVISNML